MEPWSHGGVQDIKGDGLHPAHPCQVSALQGMYDVPSGPVHM